MRKLSLKLIAFVALLPAVETLSLPKLIIASAGTQRTSRSGNSWLDRAPVNWNRTMSRLPRPVSSVNDAQMRTRCRDTIRQPNTAAERALVRAGWMLYGEVQSNGL